MSMMYNIDMIDEAECKCHVLLVFCLANDQMKIL